jgi:hypothetical protein
MCTIKSEAEASQDANECEVKIFHANECEVKIFQQQQRSSVAEGNDEQNENKICEGNVEELCGSSSPQGPCSKVDDDNGKHETGEMTIDDYIAIFTRWEKMMPNKDDS